MAAPKFTPERFAEVYNDTARFPDLAAVAAELGVGYQTVRNYATMYRRRRGEGEAVPELTSRKTPAPVADGTSRTIETQLPAYEEPIEDLIKRATEHNARYAQHHEAKAIIDVSVKFPGPYGVVGLPDHHLNNIGTNLAAAFDDAHLIADHPHLFAVGIGDWIDNFIVGRLERERRKDVMSHSDAWRLLEHYVAILAPKLIAAISGNHMDWSTEAGGVDLMKRLFAGYGLGAVYDTDEVRVRLTSPGGATFTHLARHKYKGNSRFNSMHAIMVHILERWQGEDVIWGGHIHQAGHASLEKQWLGRSRVVHGIQLGAYKQIDGYARREHFRPNVPFLTPVTIHDPASGRTIFFDDVREGVRYLDMLRGEGRAAA
jgi:hypothetical protein